MLPPDVESTLWNEHHDVSPGVEGPHVPVYHDIHNWLGTISSTSSKVPV